MPTETRAGLFSGMAIAVLHHVKIAIPSWSGRVSPVFDVATRLMLFHIEGGREVIRYQKPFEQNQLAERAAFIAKLGVEKLICGAISEPLRLILEANGIEVIAHVCGDTDRILQAFLEGDLTKTGFLMPGFGRDTDGTVRD